MSTYRNYLGEKKCCLFQENTSRGPIGLKGIEGDSGPSGLPGLTGPTGISGTKGAAVRGDSGPTGPLNTANKLQKISLFSDDIISDYNIADVYDSIILIPPSGITLLAGNYAIQWSLSIPLGSSPPDSFVYLSFESTQTVNIYNTNVYDELNPCAMIIQGNNMTACGNEILNLTEDDLIQCSVNFKATTTLTNFQCYFNVSINPNPLSIL
jgi:hypothetical protein